MSHNWSLDKKTRNRWSICKDKNTCMFKIKYIERVPSSRVLYNTAGNTFPIRRDIKEELQKKLQ